MSSRRRKSILISLGLGFLIFHFQNCGSPSNQVEGISSDGEMRIVDDWRSKPLQFTEELVQLRDGVESMGAQGLCLRKESKPLRWQLFDAENQVVRHGEVPCELGGFQIGLQNLNELRCGQEYQLVVQSDLKGDAELSLMIKCPALLSVEIVDEDFKVDSYSNQNGYLASQPVCFKELEQLSFEVGESACQRVCYIGDRLSERVRLRPSECSDLVARSETAQL